MSLKKIALVAALGLSMASAPVMAQTASAQRTGAALQQASAQNDDDDDGGTGALYGGTQTYIIAFFVIVAIGLGLYFAFNEDDDDAVST